MKRILGDKRGSRLSGPRKGRRFSPAEFRKCDWDVDDAPLVSGRVGHALETKLIGKRRCGRGLSSKPLERYLSSQVGRLWNDVFSDISSALRNSNLAGEHLRSLLATCVAIRLQVVEGMLLWEDWRHALLQLSNENAPRLYVNPVDGRLYRNNSIETPRMRRKRLAAVTARELELRMRVLSPTRQLHRLADGNWWEVEVQNIVVARERGITVDVVLGAGLSNLRRDELYARRNTMAVGKRQLSARDMKRFGLR